jgi:hypothetical protein
VCEVDHVLYFVKELGPEDRRLGEFSHVGMLRTVSTKTICLSSPASLIRVSSLTSIGYSHGSYRVKRINSGIDISDQGLDHNHGPNISLDNASHSMQRLSNLRGLPSDNNFAIPFDHTNGDTIKREHSTGSFLDHLDDNQRQQYVVP